MLVAQLPVRHRLSRFSDIQQGRRQSGSLHGSAGRHVPRTMASAMETENTHKDDGVIRVMFAAGGTGGHVFPAIAIADELSASPARVQINFVGTDHRFESRAVPRAGYSLFHIPAVALRRPILFSLQNVFLPFRLLLSVCVSLFWVLKLRPHVVVGTGGYVSLPVCLAAMFTRTAFAIQEQNAYPGIANRVLARFAATVFVAFAASLAYFPPSKCKIYGNPVRSSLFTPVPQITALCHFFPKWKSRIRDYSYSDAEVVLIQGGSLGSRSINQAVSEFVMDMLNSHPHRFIIWQIGSRHFRDTISKIDPHERLVTTEFIEDMKLAYSAADLVVASGGAITCSELLISGKPSVLIPLEYVVNDHQSKNAIALQEIGASKVIHDRDLTAGKLRDTIDNLLGDPRMLSTMRNNALREASPNASKLIADELLYIARTMVLKIPTY